MNVTNMNCSEILRYFVWKSSVKALPVSLHPDDSLRAIQKWIPKHKIALQNIDFRVDFIAQKSSLHRPSFFIS